MTDDEILAALARNLMTFRDDTNKIVLMMHLFGRRHHEAHERLREIGYAQPEHTGDRLQVLQLTLTRIG